MIKHIRIQNYRSLVDVSVDLDPLTVLIGRSGTGKSNFVRAVRFLRDVLTSPQLRHERLGVGERQKLHPVLKPEVPLRFEVLLAVNGITEPFEYHLEFGKLAHVEFGQAIEERLAHGKNVIFHQRERKWVVEPQVQPRPQPATVILGALTGIREATIAHVALTNGIGCYDFPGDVLQKQGDAAHNGTGFRDHTAKESCSRVWNPSTLGAIHVGVEYSAAGISQ